MIMNGQCRIVHELQNRCSIVILSVDDEGKRDFTSTVQCVTAKKFEKGVAPDLGPKNFEGNIDFDIGKKSRINFKIDKNYFPSSV